MDQKSHLNTYFDKLLSDFHHIRAAQQWFVMRCEIAGVPPIFCYSSWLSEASDEEISREDERVFFDNIDLGWAAFGVLKKILDQIVSELDQGKFKKFSFAIENHKIIVSNDVNVEINRFPKLINIRDAVKNMIMTLRPGEVIARAELMNILYKIISESEAGYVPVEDWLVSHQLADVIKAYKRSGRWMLERI